MWLVGGRRSCNPAVSGHKNRTSDCNGGAGANTDHWMRRWCHGLTRHSDGSAHERLPLISVEMHDCLLYAGAGRHRIGVDGEDVGPVDVVDVVHLNLVD